MNKPAKAVNHDQVLKESSAAVRKLDSLPKCQECNGNGTIKPLFHELECYACSGTGLDLSDPLAIIELQRELLGKAKAVIVHQRQSLYNLTVSEEQRTADNMSAFYAACKRID